MLNHRAETFISGPWAEFVLVEPTQLVKWLICILGCVSNISIVMRPGGTND